MERFNPLIKKVNDLISSYTRSNLNLLNNAVSDLIGGGGKRLRPLLAIIAGKAGEYEEDKLLQIAVGLEFLHMATLVHDDIIDEAELRRGIPSAQNKFGKDVAVFVGDFLLSKSNSLFTRILSRHSMNRLSKIIILIIEGEIRQYQDKYNPDIRVINYLRRIRRKTALLFGASTYLGAYESGLRGRPLHHLYKLGLELGMAFQIQDDLLDFTGRKQKTGKHVGQDMTAGIYTLPMIYLLRDSSLSSRAREILGGEGSGGEEELPGRAVEEINQLIQQGGFLEKSRELAQKYIDKARGHLAALPPGDYREDLNFIIERQLRRER